MMKRKTKRLWIIVACMIGLGLALTLILSAFSSNLVYFKAPSQIINHPTDQNHIIRLGGMVVNGSVHHSHQGQTPMIQFQVTDGQAAVEVHFTGVVPDLFREGQSVIAIGRMKSDNVFIANEILAKHDETYMPKDVADALKRSGKWDPRYGPPPDSARWNHMTKPEK